jgi:hypothetical protein
MPRKRSWRKWAIAGLAAAAGLAIAALALPRKASPVVSVVPPPVVDTAPPVVAVAPETAPEGPSAPEVVPARSVKSAVADRPNMRVRRGGTQQLEQFIALDSEPFETGLVVRVALGPDEVQADVVFSPDGRARAYRLVGEKLN